MSSDLIKIGQRIRQIRGKQRLTLNDLARKCELSKGLISKIENFRTIPSLPVLAKIADALNVDMAELVENISGRKKESYVLVKAADHTRLEREKARGFSYFPLSSKHIDRSFFESFLVELEPGSKRQTVSTDGDEFLYMIEGQIDFLYGKETIQLSEGDSLLFDGRISHVPRNTGKKASFIVIYLISEPKE